MKSTESLTDYRILITGGSGFIGTNLVNFYIKSGCEILNLDINEPKNILHSNVYHKTDLLDYESLKDEIQHFKPHYIYHMAARTDLNGKNLEDYSANTQGVQNLIQAIKGLECLNRVIFASSRLVCKIGYQPMTELDYCPTTYYGESKALGEKIVREQCDNITCPWIIVRPTSIWGPWFDIPYKTFFLAIARGQYFHPGQKEVYKSFGYVGNTVYELDRLMIAPSAMVNQKVLYLEDYPPVNLRKMADYIQEIMQVKKIKTVPLMPLRLAAFLGDAMKFLGWCEPPLTSFRLDNLMTTMVYDSYLLEQIVGDLPFTMEEGIVETVKWMRNQGEINIVQAEVVSG
jgi:nucleoside-diphosphate-sugar epimerase